MANELDIIKNGFPVTVQYVGTNVALSTTATLTLDQSGVGYTVPTGYVGHAVALAGSASAALTTGASVTFKVLDDGTALDNGPQPALDGDTRSAVAVERLGTEPMAAGSVVAVSVTTNSTGTSTTDYDAVLSLVLTPA